MQAYSRAQLVTDIELLSKQIVVDGNLKFQLVIQSVLNSNLNVHRQ